MGMCGFGHFYGFMAHIKAWTLQTSTLQVHCEVVSEIRKYFCSLNKFIHRAVGVVGKEPVIGTEGPGFDSRAGQIGHSVAKGSPPLQRFFGAVLPRP